MHRLPVLAILVFFIFFWVLSTDALQHRPLLIQPPQSMNQDNAKPTPEQVTLRKRIDLLQLQKEADDLARTAQTIPTDMATVRKGMLPKDVIEKLKQIEKLSKRLRTELTP